MKPLLRTKRRRAHRYGVVACLPLAVWLAIQPMAARGAAPVRVVSLNVCTDQLAMLVAAPGQLAAVSHLAREPQQSALVEEARAYPITTGHAEDVFRLAPDLVLAGIHTTPETVRLLQRLGVRVERFESATAVEAVAIGVRRMGRLLGREERAERLAAAVERRLAAVAADRPERPRIGAVFLDANSYTAGSGTLMHAVIQAAGLRNIAAELGLARTARLPLEALVLAHPGLLLVPQRYGHPSMGEAVLDHPAVRALVADRHRAVISGAESTCATPATITAVERLAALRRRLAARERGS